MTDYATEQYNANSHKCWTEHHNYTQISTLTSASMVCCKECRGKIDREIDGLMYEAFEDGYNMEGWEPIESKEYYVGTLI